MLTDTTKSQNAVIKGLPFGDVEWTDGLYKERFETCANSMVPHLQKMFESKDISHVLENFKIAAQEKEGNFDGTVFGDGDFYKWMEAAVYTGVRKKNQQLLEQLDEYVELIGKAQQADGYISTKQIIGERKGEQTRLGDINDFEVYNFGHLFTSACLYLRLTGKDRFLKIAEKAANYLEKLYDEAKQKGEIQTAVCPSHYMGLAELYRTTQKEKYLKLLETAITLRDSVQEGLDDNQDRLPLRKHEKIIGHAVRANYLYAGVADFCMENSDSELVEVLHKVWDNLVNQKLYITGGCGALYNAASPYGNFFHHQLVHQAYGYEYQLPNMTAYNETCASIGGVYWAWRMFCLEKKAEYIDVLERMVLNVNLAAVSMDGKKFFYENMLRRAKEFPVELVWGQERAEYILSYCCPPNLARMIAQTSEYAYAIDRTGVYTALYGASTAKIQLKETGKSFTIYQKTEYPYDGTISFSFDNIVNGTQIEFHLRIPAWVKNGSVLVKTKQKTEQQIVLDREMAGSYLSLKLEQLTDTEIIVDFDMQPRLTCAHALVEETVNQVAVEKGPLVYCIEGIDAETETLDDVMIPTDVCLKPETIMLEGREIITLKGKLLKRKTEGNHLKNYDRTALYQEFINRGVEEVSVRMIPYFAWDNRGMDEMRIWFPVIY